MYDENVLTYFHHHGVSNKRLLDIMYNTPRQLYVPFDFVLAADKNKAIPIGMGQYAPKPIYIAQSLQLVLGNTDNLGKVLEIGTGSGFQTALLYHFAEELHSIERVHNLLEFAAENLAQTFEDRFSLIYDDGFKGLEEYAPFNTIVVSAYTSKLPIQLTHQLDPNGGKLVYPKGNIFRQKLATITRNHNDFEEEIFNPCRFCKLKHGVG